MAHFVKITAVLVTKPPTARRNGWYGRQHDYCHELYHDSRIWDRTGCCNPKSIPVRKQLFLWILHILLIHMQLFLSGSASLLWRSYDLFGEGRLLPHPSTWVTGLACQISKFLTPRFNGPSHNFLINLVADLLDRWTKHAGTAYGLVNLGGNRQGLQVINGTLCTFWL